jgi:signal transduction histidine kinase
MRLMLYQLRPYSLGDKGLVGALQQRLETVEERAGIDVDLFVEGQTDLPPPVEETLYRIVQEALNNSLKHAAASKVRVSIQTTDHLLEIRVVDNGVGFDPTCLSPTAGMGMASMRERAAELGATLDISSVPGDGTRVSLVMDLEAQIPIVDQERGYQ